MLFATEFVSLTLLLFYDRANLFHDWFYTLSWNQKVDPYFMIRSKSCFVMLSCLVGEFHFSSLN